MKYIKERKLFISNVKQPLINPELFNQDSNLITEIVGNDIRFGGTWFGRLINSTIRRATNSYKGTQVTPLVTKVRDQLYLMLDENMSGELKNEYGYYLYRIAMSNVNEMVKNEDIEFEDKKIQLIGKNGNSGLIQTAIKALTELNLKDKSGDYQYKIDNRDFILKQLRDFAQKLKNLKNPKSEAKSEEKEEEAPQPTKPQALLTYGGTPSNSGPSASQDNNNPTGPTGPVSTNEPENKVEQNTPLSEEEKKKIEDQIKIIQNKINNQKQSLQNTQDPNLDKKRILEDIIKDEKKIDELKKKIPQFDENEKIKGQIAARQHNIDNLKEALKKEKNPIEIKRIQNDIKSVENDIVELNKKLK